MRSPRETSGDPIIVITSPRKFCTKDLFSHVQSLSIYKKHRRYEPTQNDNKEEEELLCLLCCFNEELQRCG